MQYVYEGTKFIQITDIPWYADYYGNTKFGDVMQPC